MDPLKYIFQKPMPTGRLAKWQILLTEFDIIYVTRTAMKAQAMVDHLAENPVDEEYEPLKTYFPDEEVMYVDEADHDEKLGWKLFFDGAANMKGVEIWDALISKTRHHYPVTAQLRFYCTNNMTKYKACILGLRLAINKGVQEILVLGDSDLSVEFRHIPRIYNEIVDALATLASMLHHPDKTYIDPLHIHVRDQHTYCNVVEKEIDSEPWFHDVKEYIKLGVHDDLIHSPPSELHTMSALWPFVTWGMDVIGPIEPAASSEHRFILLAIDYFTKWVEVVTFKSVTKKAMVDFVHSNIICRFRIPKVIITDNAANLNSHLMKEVCQQFKIMHRNSTPYHPKVNGVVEAANKNVKKILRKMVQGSRQWHEKLPFALLGYRTTVRTSVGATPYLLKRMERAYNKKVRPRKFEVGQLVLKHILPHQAEAKGKFTPKWQGPFIVTKVLPNGAFI
ncbi:uncharacterized protein [Nicotiana tomentosiformis]|uniref:uncharacterized protein n=1 Tax=Nicotiana tomentosiformis TaxID=4098 RepID=UPI00388CEC1C